MELQEAQIRKMQVQILQFETSADFRVPAKEKTDATEEQAKSYMEGEQDTKGDETTNDDTMKALEEENSRLRENVRLLSSQVQTIFILLCLILSADERT